MNTAFLILAAGRSTRMNSNLPKALHTINGIPMLRVIIDRLKSHDILEDDIFIVVHYKKELIISYINECGLKVNIIEQESPVGTADAVKTALPFVDSFEKLAVLCTDVPLVDIEKILGMSDKLEESDICLMTATIDEPFGYGRIIRDDKGNIQKIIEQKDIQNGHIEAINEINTGILVAKLTVLQNLIPSIKNENAQKEYYLTDLIELAGNNDYMVSTEPAGSRESFLGVNNYFQLTYLERIHKTKIILDLIKKGIRFINPESVEIHGSIEINGKDIIIAPNVILKGKITFGNNVYVESFTHLENVELEDDIIIKSFSYVLNSKISSGAMVGPHTHIRANCEIGPNTKIGSFVELKNTTIGNSTKVPHLSYVGDAELGENSNIGAGVIFCNYDGKNKHKTKIGNNVFVGSNSSLVAPLELVDDVFVGAGSIITKDVESPGLVVNKRETIFKKKNSGNI